MLQFGQQKPHKQAAGDSVHENKSFLNFPFSG
jgi:hypothetical protein